MPLARKERATLHSMYGAECDMMNSGTKQVASKQKTQFTTYHWHFGSFIFLGHLLLVPTLRLPSVLRPTQETKSRVVRLTQLALEDKMADVREHGEGGGVGKGNERVSAVSH